jgi:hypothetical protein
MSYSVATCFDQLYGHQRATLAHETKITVANFISSRDLSGLRKTI